MSHDSDERAGAPEDRLFVRPYVAPSGEPSHSMTPVWPHTGPVPVSFDAPEAPHGDPEPSGPAPGAAPGAATASAGGGRAARRERGSRRAPAVLALLALGAAGGLVFLLSGPDPEPERAAPPDLAFPVLPARSPGAGDEPSPGRSVRSSTPSATASASAAPSAAQTSKPAPTPSGAKPGRPQPGDSGTLRMGDRGPEVSALQERLYGQGFTYVSVTGVYDSQTKRGVAQLQRDRDIKGDQPGVYGPATQAAFGG
ncbi:peptidoglycan-binding domain-containing protein [Streptomyces sp. NPDC097981]|uniref:peptidoglycan-binding domain-containing protein n=1 Tax=Streptomyces sp. NPDC097981 TaxID=3155428 RepID=UPI003321E38B